MYPSFFGKYANTFKVDANQSKEAYLEKNDLQVGKGTVSNTASSVEFSSMVHSMGLVNLTLGSKTVPSTRVFKPGSTSDILFDRAPTTSITATSNFTASVSNTSTNSYNKTTGIYLLIGKPSSTVTFAGNSSEKYTWNSTYTFSKNTGDVKTVTPSREYDNVGWGYGAIRAEQTFTAYAGTTYMLEVWGSAAREASGSWTGATPGKGGYSFGKFTPKIQTTLYVYVGDSLMYNGGGRGGHGLTTADAACGGGATHVATASGILSSLSSLQNTVLIVAGGGGGCEWSGQGGYGGGKKGGDGSKCTIGNEIALGAKGASENSGGASYPNESGIVVNGSFGQGGSGYKVISSNNDYGGGGGGGWYGGGGTSYAGAGGGGSGHVNSTALTDADTIAGNESFTAPSGKNETGHSESGYAIITQLSY